MVSSWYSELTTGPPNVVFPPFPFFSVVWKKKLVGWTALYCNLGGGRQGRWGGWRGGAGWKCCCGILPLISYQLAPILYVSAPLILHKRWRPLSEKTPINALLSKLQLGVAWEVHNVPLLSPPPLKRMSVPPSQQLWLLRTQMLILCETA